MSSASPAESVVEHPHSGDSFPCFDGLRALAALAVVVTHVAFSSGATRSMLANLFDRLESGIAVFFVLSGFLLYRPFLLADVRGRTRPGTAQFLWRRALRIYPAYWLVITVILFVLPKAPTLSPTDMLLNYSLLNNYFPRSAPLVLGPSWTLTIEVSFYLVMPIWAYLLSRTRSDDPWQTLRCHTAGIAALVVASLAWKVLAVAGPLTDLRVYEARLWLPWWLDLFAIGMFFAIASVAIRELQWPTPLRLDRPWAPVICWLLAAATLMLVSQGIGLHEPILIPRHLLMPQHYLYGLIGGLLVLPAVFGPQTRESSLIRRFLTTPVLVYLGLISYGIYLWHTPLITRYIAWTGQWRFSPWQDDVPFAWHTTWYFSIPFIVMLVAVVAMTVIVASASWWLVERPALKLKRLGQRSRAPQAT